MIRFYDTNALLELEDYDEYFYISSVTLTELEAIKQSGTKSEEVKYKARRTAKLLRDNQEMFSVIAYGENKRSIITSNGLEETPDNKICACAKWLSVTNNNDLMFVTNDVCCQLMAKLFFGLNAEPLKSKIANYVGYKEVVMNAEELAHFYENLSSNQFDLIPNEYLIIKNDDGDVVDKFKWNGEYHKTVVDKTIKSNMFGALRPLDEIQSCAIDSISSNDVTVLYGRAGSGKTTLPLYYMMQQVEKGKFKKIYIVYSYEPLKSARELGYEKGSHTDKLLYSASIGNILASKFGDREQVEYMIERGMIDIIPTANIRGVEFEKDSCVFVTECQNIDVYTLKTIIQRCKSGCKQVYEGDIIEQTDKNISVIGMNRLIDVFKGSDFFGCIKLKNNYRSEIGELADRL